MTNPFASAIARTAADSPMGGVSVPVVRSRILLVDGDGLAYYCAGKDDSDAGLARAALRDKVSSAARIVGAERIIVLLTASGSHKGHRYAIARVKPYQGQRANSRRPTNWRALRDYMESPEFPFEVESTQLAEADDLFGMYAYRQPDSVVIYTQDKDMRMLPGMHLDWVNHRAYTVPHYLYIDDNSNSLEVFATDSIFNEKQYGPKWFWLQMLHGDAADNIPGLPKYLDSSGKLKPVGEVTAGKLLSASHGFGEYSECVAHYYRGYYGDRWLVEMMEQACLLWMRRVPEDWDDCMNPGGPLACFNDGGPEFAKAYLEIQGRVRDADNINSSAAEVNGDSQDTGSVSSSTEQPLCNMPTAIV